MLRYEFSNIKGGWYPKEYKFMMQFKKIIKGEKFKEIITYSLNYKILPPDSDQTFSPNCLKKADCLTGEKMYSTIEKPIFQLYNFRISGNRVETYMYKPRDDKIIFFYNGEISEDVIMTKELFNYSQQVGNSSFDEPSELTDDQLFFKSMTDNEQNATEPFRHCLSGPPISFLTRELQG